jgi:hypothetical protein
MGRHRGTVALCLELGSRRDLAYCYFNWGLLARKQRDRKAARKIAAALISLPGSKCRGNATKCERNWRRLSRLTEPPKKLRKSQKVSHKPWFLVRATDR